MAQFMSGRFQMPPVVKNIIIINAIMLLLQYVLSKFHIDLDNYLGLHYWKSYYFQPWQLLTHIFMHANVLHLVSNMFGLWMLGSILENMWGGKRFLIFYLICGLGAAFCHLMVLHFEYSAIEKAFIAFQQSPTLDHFQQFLKSNGLNGDQFLAKWQQDPGNTSYMNEAISQIYQYLHGTTIGSMHQPGMYDQVTVGASGAVFGVLFAFGYLFPNMELFIIPIPFPVKAKYFVTVYALIELYSGLSNSAGDNVAHFAHIGGMLFAFIILKIWGSKGGKRFY
jgi:membrane associated rhomboid family serine protease